MLPPAPAIGLPSWLGPAITLLLWPGQPATLTGCSGEGMLPGEQGRGAVNPPSSSSSPRGIRKEGPVTLFPPPTQLRIHRESGVLGAQTSGRNRAPPPSPAWAQCGQLVSEALGHGQSASLSPWSWALHSCDILRGFCLAPLRGSPGRSGLPWAPGLELSDVI